MKTKLSFIFCLLQTVLLSGQNKFFINFGNTSSDNYTVIITDPTEKNVLNKKYNNINGIIRVDAETLSAGMYFISIFNNQKHIQKQKIIITR